MEVNPVKFHILLSNKKTEKVTINDVILTSSAEEKLLCVTLNSELKFENHVTGTCKKTQIHRCSVQSYKLHAAE